MRGLYGKVFSWGVRTDWATKERGLCEKTEGKYFPVQAEQTRLIIHLLYGFWFIFVSVYSVVFVFRCCRLSYLWASWFRFIFTLVRYSFTSLIDFRKSNTNVPGRVIVRTFPKKTYLILFRYSGYCGSTCLGFGSSFLGGSTN